LDTNKQTDKPNLYIDNMLFRRRIYGWLLKSRWVIIWPSLNLCNQILSESFREHR